MTPEEFLNAFFGDGNEIDRASVDRTPDLRALAEPVMAGLAEPAVLPRRRGREVDWFVLCRDDATLRTIQSEVQAFIGPSYARWDGVRATLDEDDPVERALLGFAGPRVLLFRTRTDDEYRDCWAAVRLMRSVWHQRPRPEPESARSGAALVTESELALAAGDRTAARDAFAELRRRGLLGAENLRFLEIRLLAADRRWSELASAADLGDLARLRRPWLVTEDLLTALYEARIVAHEQADDVAGAITATAAIVEELPGLLAGRGPLRSADVLKLFALRHALPAVADPVRVRELIDEPGLSPAERRWLTTIAESLTAPTAVRQTAHDALLTGDLDGALALAQAEPPGRAQADVLIACADELQTLGSAEAALNALDALSDGDRSALLERKMVRSAVDRLRGLFSPEVEQPLSTPQTWTAWLQRLLDEPDWPNSQAVAICGELEYSASDLSDSEAAGALPRLVEQVADSPRRRALQDALPQIVGWLERQDLDVRLARPMHDAILTAVAFATDRSPSSLETAYNATDGLIRAGVDEMGYQDILDRLDELWKRMAARANVPWYCDMLELLSFNPGPRDQLISFSAATLPSVLGFARQLDSDILSTLAATVTSFGAEDLATQLISIAVDAVKPEIDDTVLAGRLVGIYTLTPQVAIRAREGIERRFPGVRVQIDSSLDSTQSLEHLAATADYLIVSIRSAKHAATDAIDRHRPRDLPTLITRGRGSSRMVEALVTAVASPA
jgi:hypothetical protein